MRCVLVLMAVLLMAGCGDSRPPKPSAAENPDAEAVAQALERDCRSFTALAPEERAAAEPAFGKRLARDLESCRGTRYENVPLYLLAQWTMAADDDGAAERALPLLDRLDLLPNPAYRVAGKALRVQALLATGQTAQARALANELDQTVPEFRTKELVAFHDQVGGPAPALPGVHAGGPQGAGDASSLLVVFVGAADVFAARRVRTWTQVGIESTGRLTVVAVATGGDLLAAAGVAPAWGCEVRWTRPEDHAWVDAWRLPVVPATVLLGPGPSRTILAVNPTRDRVRQALGLPR